MTTITTVIINGADFQAEYEEIEGNVALFGFKHNGDDILDIINGDTVMMVADQIENSLNKIGE